MLALLNNFKFQLKALFLIALLFSSYLLGSHNKDQEWVARNAKSEQRHAKEIQAVQDELHEVEREYLNYTEKRKVVYKIKYKEAKDEIQTDIRNNDLHNCTINSSSVQRINEAIRLQK